jgi:hypothetical protein
MRINCVETNCLELSDCLREKARLQLKALLSVIRERYARCSRTLAHKTTQSIRSLLLDARIIVSNLLAGHKILLSVCRAQVEKLKVLSAARKYI